MYLGDYQVMLSSLTNGFNPDYRNNESCGHGLQEHLMQSDVLVKYLLDLSSCGRVLVEGVDYS